MNLPRRTLLHTALVTWLGGHAHLSRGQNPGNPVASNPAGASGPGQVASPASDFTAAQHMALAWAHYRQGVSTEQEHMQVRVTRPGQAPEVKTLTRWCRLSPEGDKVLVRFSAPAADKGLGLLIVRAPQRDTQMWMRQPSWTQARRIAADREGRPFGGTDLSFEDNRQLLGEAVADFQYRILAQEGSGWLIEALPREGVTSAYGMRHIRLTPQHAVAEIRYFDRQMRPLKTQRHDGLDVAPGGRWRARSITIDHHQDPSQTVLEVVQRQLNPTVVDRLFTPATLAED